MTQRPRRRPDATGNGNFALCHCFLPLAVLLAGSAACCSTRRAGVDALVGPDLILRFVTTPPNLDDPQELSAANDSLGFLIRCRERCAEHIVDYICRFHRTEPGLFGVADEEIAVRFRESPFSVDMRWIRNPGLARRVTYVAGRWSDDGREFALIDPHGVFGLLFPRGVKRNIHGPEMRRAARRTLDQFGFRNTLDMIIGDCETARGDPGYSLGYVGQGMVDGRSTLFFDRRLPFTSPDQPYPDRRLIVGIDRLWLVPTSVHAYADDAGRELLGSYVTTDVELNVGLTDADF